MTLPIPNPNERIINPQGQMSPVWRRFLAQVGQATTTDTVVTPTITLGEVLGLNGITVTGDLQTGLKIRFSGSIANLSGVDLANVADGDALLWDDASGTFIPGPGGAATVADTAPASPRQGQPWVDTTDGTLYIWYDDGTSAAWVAFGSAGGGTSADNITYNNTTSGLTSDNVQDALDELAAGGGGGGGSTPTGTGFRHVTSGAEDAAAVTIDGISAATSGDVKVIAPATHAASSKSTPVDADELPLVDSAASNVLKKLTWANLKATLKTYFDTIYATTAGANVWTTVKKTSDQDRASTTTLADDSALTIACAATTRYNIRGRIYYVQANATMDFKYGFAYSGTTTSAYTRRAFVVPGSAGTAGESQATFASLLAAENATTTVSGGLGFLNFDVVMLTNASGTFSFQWAQNTSDAGNLTVLAGSYLEYATF